MNVSKPIRCSRFVVTVVFVVLLVGGRAEADSFGSGANQFSIDFVSVGNAGNPDNSAVYWSNIDETIAFGGVAYDYRIATFEVTQGSVLAAIDNGLTGVIINTLLPSNSMPATQMSWYEAAQFTNWLNTSTGHQAAYNLTWNGGNNYSFARWAVDQAWAGDTGRFRHKDARYFLPSFDEFYKAAYHKNNGSTADYWRYATRMDLSTTPTAPQGLTFVGDSGYDAYFRAVPANPNLTQPTNVASSSGVLGEPRTSSYGTYGQDGNVQELLEGSVDPSPNDLANGRLAWGGSFLQQINSLGVVPTDGIGQTSLQTYSAGTQGLNRVGFRVTSVVPEPSAAILFIAAGSIWLVLRRKR